MASTDLIFLKKKKRLFFMKDTRGLQKKQNFIKDSGTKFT